MNTEKEQYNLWQVVHYLKDVLNFKILETKILLFTEMVKQGHTTDFVKRALTSGKINISAEFNDSGVVKKILLLDVNVMETKSKYGGDELSDIMVTDVLIDGKSIFTPSTTGN